MATPPYPFLDTVHLPSPIVISDKDGGGSVTLSNFLEPPVIPEFERLRRVTLHDMASPGLSQPGNRVIEAYQTNENRWDWEATVDMITPAQLASIRGYVTGDTTNPGYVRISDASINYLGIMAQDYPKVQNYRYNLRTMHKVQLKVHILGVV